MILLCYDGSSDAQSAIDHAGELLPGQSVTVLTVWEPFIDVMTRTGTGLGLGAAPLNVDEIDAASEKAARERAEEGVERARQPGLNPQPRTSARGATIAHTILSEADEAGAGAIVVGTRGLTGLKSLLLGSVSHALLEHADRQIIPFIPHRDLARGLATDPRVDTVRDDKRDNMGPRRSAYRDPQAQNPPGERRPLHCGGPLGPPG